MRSTVSPAIRPGETWYRANRKYRSWILRDSAASSQLLQDAPDTLAKRKAP